MFYIKKSSLFFLKSLKLQSIFINNKILVFFDYFDFSFIKDLLFENISNFFLLSSFFIDFFFKIDKFFKFLKSKTILFYFNIFEDFFFFLEKKKKSSIFFIGFSYYGVFLNSKFFFNLFDFFSFLKFETLKKIFFLFFKVFYFFFFSIYILFFIFSKIFIYKK